MCMAGDESNSKTVVSLTTILLLLLMIFLLHILLLISVADADQQHMSVMNNANDSKSSQLNKEHTVHRARSKEQEMEVTGQREEAMAVATHSTSLQPYDGSRLFNASDHEVPSGPNPISN